MSDDKAPKKRGRRSDIPWADIRAAFEAGETSVSKLSKQFDVARGPITKHRDDEKWTVTEHAKEQIADAARSNVIDIATKKAIEQLGGEQAVADKAASAIAETLEAQVPLFAQAAKLLNKTFTRALNMSEIDENGQPVKNRLILGEHQGETTAVTDLLNALSKFTRDTRLINGLRDGTSNEAIDGEKDSKRVDQAILVVRKPAQVA